MSIDMTLPKWAIFTMGVYGGNSHFCRIQLKFRFGLHKKGLHISCKFQLEIKRNKKAFDKLIWNEQIGQGTKTVWHRVNTSWTVEKNTEGVKQMKFERD